MKKLMLICALVVPGYVFSQVPEGSAKQPTIQKSKEGKLSCSITTSANGRMEYLVSGPSMKSIKKLSVLRCFSKALRAQPKEVLTEEVPVSAQVHSEVLGGIRCYKTDTYIVKFRNEVPDNVEGVTAYCYKKAWDDSQNKENLRTWT